MLTQIVHAVLMLGNVLLFLWIMYFSIEVLRTLKAIKGLLEKNNR